MAGFYLFTQEEYDSGVAVCQACQVSKPLASFDNGYSATSEACNDCIESYYHAMVKEYYDNRAAGRICFYCKQVIDADAFNDDVKYCHRCLDRLLVHMKQLHSYLDFGGAS